MTDTSSQLVTPSPVTSSVVMDGKVKRDGWGRYIIPDPFTGEPMSWTRTTTFAKTISDTYKLHLWQLRMLAKGLNLRPDLAAAIAVTEDKDEIDKLCAKAMEAAGSKVGANLGTVVHTLTERLDKGEDLNPVPAILVKSLRSYAETMHRHNLRTYRDADYMAERTIVCPELGVAGTFDRVLEAVGPVGNWVKGNRMIGDVKTAANIGYSWLEVAVQLSIYAHGFGIWNWDTQEFEEMPDVDQNEAIVMHVPIPETPEDGYCDLYRIDIKAGWEYAQLCKLVRDSRKDRNLAMRLGEPSGTLPFNAPKITAAPMPAVVPVQLIDWRARIDAATIRADLSGIWEAATARGEWTPELEAYGLNKAKDLRG